MMEYFTKKHLGKRMFTKEGFVTEQRRWRYAGIAAGMFAVLILICAGLTGCGAKAEEDRKIQDMEFTVVGEKDVPPALSELIAKKKENAFKLTYADGQDMYIVIGAGAQAGGGYSVTVKELYLTDNSIVIRTELLGPEKKEATGSNASYPVLIVKTAFREEPVVFY